MSWLALWLLAIAVMDLVRPVVGARRELAPAIGSKLAREGSSLAGSDCLGAGAETAGAGALGAGAC